jgi:hypothetical protein
MHKWFVDTSSIVSWCTSLCNYSKLLDIRPKGPKHVADKLQTIPKTHYLVGLISVIHGNECSGPIAAGKFLNNWEAISGCQRRISRPFKTKAVRSFETSGTGYPVTRLHIPSKNDGLLKHTAVKTLRLAKKILLDLSYITWVCALNFI